MLCHPHRLKTESPTGSVMLTSISKPTFPVQRIVRGRGWCIIRSPSYNRIKMLMWEGNGFVLYYKALAEERFIWPKHDERLISLTGQQINFLLDGMDIMALRGHRTLDYESVF